MVHIQIVVDEFPANPGTCPECGKETYGIKVEHHATFPCRCESGLLHYGEACKCGWQTPGMCNDEAFARSLE